MYIQRPIRPLFTPLMTALILLVYLFGCDQERPSPTLCSRSEDCARNEMCVEQRCEPRALITGGELLSAGVDGSGGTQAGGAPAGGAQAGGAQAGGVQAGGAQAGGAQAGGADVGGVQAGGAEERCEGRGCPCIGSWDCSPEELCLRSTRLCVPIECERNLDCPIDSVCSFGLCLADTSQDREHDGVPDAVDNCPDHINPGQDDLDRDGDGDLCDPDIDGDGVNNDVDNCVYTPNPGQRDLDEDDVGDVCVNDRDNDGVFNEEDNCPLVYNPPDLITLRQRDLDGDGLGDLCDPDLDGDSALNADDNCPLTRNSEQRDHDGDGLGNRCDPDIDGDGVRNQFDNCPLTPNPGQEDESGRGVGDACNGDLDLDGVISELDNCPLLYNPAQADLDDDGLGDACDPDIDEDGIENELDLCPRDRSQDQSDLDGDGIGDLCDLDLDGDGISNVSDSCPRHPNPAQLDGDQDGVGDACDSDRDRDGIGDDLDNCPTLFNAGQRDQDLDGLGDACDDDLDGDSLLNQDDLCPYIPSPIQRDLDLDGFGDPCDPDLDGDGLLNELDNCQSTPNPNQEDTDGDGVGDACDRDLDLDDVLDEVDNCRFTPNTSQADLDLDGIGDVCDLDQDGDGVPNELDNCPRDPSPLRLDLDQDGLGDPCDPDLDGDGVLNELDNCLRVENPEQADANLNGVGDLCDRDLDQDGVVDGVDNCPELSNPNQLDLDQDGLGDLCDDDPDGDGLIGEEDLCPLTPSLIVTDLDGDGLGDPCDPDLDGDGIQNLVDNCPRSRNPEQADLDEDGVGDLCDVDSDADGSLDDHDNCPQLFNPTQADLDGDGVGDACDPDVDGDGLLNTDDRCPRLIGLSQDDLDGDGLGDDCDLDDDGDEVSDQLDNCPRLPNPEQVDLDRNGLGDLCDVDLDLDGLIDGLDNCPSTPNPAQGNLDGDGLGDACDPDADADGIEAPEDNCPLTPSLELRDLDGDGLGDPCDPDDDGDGVSDELDNCPSLSNPDQLDSDEDGEGDLCQLDFDSDGVIDSEDNCPFLSNFEQLDLDADGVGDLCDVDRDGDGVVNLDDNCPSVFSLSQRDRDADGLGDACDPDLDADQVANEVDNCPTVPNQSQIDQDQDGLGDACDLDSDNDGVPDVVDLCPLVPDPVQADLDGDGLGDLCDSDLDGDQLINSLDNCPLTPSTNRADQDGDGLGDPCDEDADGDGLLNEDDNCPLTANPDQAPSAQEGVGLACATDADGDGLIDSADLCPAVYDPAQSDLDQDGLGDACDPDIDNDGVPNSVDVCPEVYDPSQDDPYLRGVGLACAGASATQPILIFNELTRGRLDTSVRPDLRSGNCGGQGAPEVAYQLQLATNDRVYIKVKAQHQTVVGVWVDGEEQACAVDELTYTATAAQLVTIVVDGRSPGEAGWVEVEIERVSVNFGLRAQRDPQEGYQYPSDFKVADLDGDGLDELLSLDVDTHNLTLWRRPMDADGVELRYPTELTPIKIEVGQVLGGELKDVIVLNAESASLSVFEGGGAEGLGTPHHVNLPSAGLDMLALDLDQDGLDELVSLHGDGGLYLHRVTPEGLTTLDDITTLSVGVSVASGDFNGDGWTDIATLDTIHAEVSLHWGTGALALTEGEVYEAPALAERLYSADLEGDGVDDLMFFSGGELYAQLWYGEGPSSSVAPFSSRAQLEFSGGEHDAPLLTDLDQDGLLDLLVFRVALNSLRPQVYMQRPGRLWLPGVTTDIPSNTPALRRGQQKSALGDLNGDGQRELYFEGDAGKLTWVTLLDQSPYEPAIFGELTHRQQRGRVWAKGDLNGDGLMDFVMPNDGEVLITLSRPEGLYEPLFAQQTGYTTSWVQIADLNLDHRPDLLMIAGDLLMYARGNEGSREGLLDDPLTLFNLEGYKVAELVDLDQDGSLDLIVSYPERPLEVYFGDPEALFLPPVISNVSLDRDARAVAYDLDEDGDLEVLVTTHWNASNVCEVSREGLTCAYDVNSNLRPEFFERVDLDLDEGMDIVFNLVNSRNQRVYYANSLEAEALITNPMGSRSSPMFPIDINGDGALDLINLFLSYNHQAYKSFVYQTAPRVFTAPLDVLRRTGGAHWPALAIQQDLNRDGRTDLTVMNNYDIIYWIDIQGELYGHRDNEGLGVSARLTERGDQPLPLCPPMDVTGLIEHGSQVSFTVEGEPCQVARVELTIDGERSKRARWTLSAPQPSGDATRPTVTFLFGDQAPPSELTWGARALPRLHYLEGSLAQGVWSLALTHGFCEALPCSYLPELSAVTLHINPPVHDPLSASVCVEGMSPTGVCAWLDDSLSLSLSESGDEAWVALPIGEALSTQTLRITGATRDELSAQLYLAGAQVPLTVAREDETGDLELSWTVDVKDSARALLLRLRPTLTVTLPLTYHLSRSSE